jgi:hypothetical protein
MGLGEMFIRFPLPPGQEAYADIDGRHMHQYVVEQANIARRYRDAGHPKFWGRVIGTSADVEDADWLIAKFKTAGLGDVHTQPFDLVPQWFPESWHVTVSGAGKTVTLESAQPDYGAVGTAPEGLDLEAIYAGLGSERATTTRMRSSGATPTCRNSGTQAVRRGPSSRGSPPGPSGSSG